MTDPAEIRAEGRKMLAKYRNADGDSTDEAKAIELWFWGWVDELLRDPEGIDEDGVEHICHALIEVGPWDEIDGDGTEASIIADHIRDLGRLPATPLSEGEVATALKIIEDSRRTHVEWVDYLSKFGADLRPHEEIAGDAAHHREAVEKYDRVLALLRRLPAPDSERPEQQWWDTGHTSKSCPDCGHHWDVHTPFRGCISGCSCKNDPPNQPAPDSERPEGERNRPAVPIEDQPPAEGAQP